MAVYWITHPPLTSIENTKEVQRLKEEIDRLLGGGADISLHSGYVEINGEVDEEALEKVRGYIKGLTEESYPWQALEEVRLFKEL